MRKLFEIPIYAINRKTLREKYSKYVCKIEAIYKHCDAATKQYYIDAETYPQRTWDYNHIVGYIRILTKQQDVIFEIYLPYQKERYSWKSKSKYFLYNIQANGTHFYVGEKRTNSDIQEQVTEMLNSIIKYRIPNRYFVDTEAFETLNGMIDYQRIIREDRENGENENGVG